MLLVGKPYICIDESAMTLTVPDCQFFELGNQLNQLLSTGIVTENGYMAISCDFRWLVTRLKTLISMYVSLRQIHQVLLVYHPSSL
jgi:hypothetical protein